ncbi:MAG: hypothetical protein JSV66_14070 [Trueperaceae bacterium]|nr:MAG: hypothetical protein JSV66_14070 [Trueperaceae bacterium]
MDDRNERQPFSRREILALIFATYRASLPYVLFFIIGLLVATWLVTTILF